MRDVASIVLEFAFNIVGLECLIYGWCVVWTLPSVIVLELAVRALWARAI